MSTAEFLKNNLTSVNRYFRKKRVLDAVKNRVQNNSGIVNVYRDDSNNVGDFYCAPHLYFDELKGNKLDIFEYKSPDKSIYQNWINQISENSLIIGGGGLLNRKCFEKQLKLFEYLNDNGKKTVIWGAGHNSKNKNDFGKISQYNINLKKFGLVGVRDYSMSESWVPCVSCMHSIFDNKFDEINEVGIIYHKDSTKNKQLLNKLNHYPSTSNTTNLEEMVSFIGKYRVIVTDTYHAMYWSMLLGKKVLVIPNSSKFYNFKYKPVFTTFDSFEEDIKKASTPDGILQECREINTKFAQKVFDYLNL